MEAISLKEFDKLSDRDYENGAVLDEIREAIINSDRYILERQACKNIES